jgi:pyruvate/2-oxoglutarate dehydrogenase complex dihydrolipoamide acyltransferase (E2) component
MRKEFKMPFLKKDASSCVLARWACEPGDVLDPGDVVLEAEADKVTEEITCTERMQISELLFEEGDEVSFGTAVAVCEVMA